MDDDETMGVPPLEQMGPADFDWSRIAAIGNAAMEGQPDDLYALHTSGALIGEWALTPFDPETGLATLSVLGIPLVTVYYSRLWKGVELDLVAEPAVRLPSERVHVDIPDDAA